MHARSLAAAGAISYVLAQCGDRGGALELTTLQATAGVNIRITHLAVIALDLLDEAVLKVKRVCMWGMAISDGSPCPSR